MDFDAAVWEQELGRPLPALMVKFCTWLTRYEYGDLGYFELSPENLTEGQNWEGMARWGATTWGFLRLPEGSVIALCEAVEPAVVVCLGSEGDLTTVAESFEAFLLALAADATGTDIDLGDEEPEDQQRKARKAFKSWLTRNKVSAPAVSGPFDFSAYASGDAPQRRVPVRAHMAGPAPLNLDHIEGMGDRLKALVQLVGRGADDGELCAVTENLFQKLPPQSIGNAKHEDTVFVSVKNGDTDFLFHRNVLNYKYPPRAIGKKALCPYLYRIYLYPRYAEPILFGLHGDALWNEIERKLPDNYTARLNEDNVLEKKCSLTLDASRDIQLKLWTTPSGTAGCLVLATGRDLASRGCEKDIHSGAGLFMQWALEQGWLEPSMFPGNEALIDAMRRREARPSQLAQLGLPRGLWDTHLSDEPGLRRFAYCYFHHLDDIWITADLKDMFGARMGPYGHQEPILDDDPASIYDQVFALFNRKFNAWKQANPGHLA